MTVSPEEKTSSDRPSPTTPPPRAYPNFSLFTLFLLIVVFSVMAAAGHYLFVELRSGRSPKAIFIIFTLASPMLLATAISLLRAAHRRLQRRRPGN